MDLTTTWNLRASAVSLSPIVTRRSRTHLQRPSLSPPPKLSCQFWAYPFPFIPNKFPALHARNRNSEPEPLLKPTIIEEVSEDDDDDDDVILDDFEEDEVSMNDEGDDYYEEDSVELYAGDGGGGGGISLAGVWWDNKALEIAEEVILSFDGDPKIYAFKTLPNFTIQVRIEKLLNRSGPQIWKTLKLFQEPIEHDLMKQKSVPENLSLEVFFYFLCSPFLA